MWWWGLATLARAATCSTDGDCSAGQICVEGACYARVADPAEPAQATVRPVEVAPAPPGSELPLAVPAEAPVAPSQEGAAIPGPKPPPARGCPWGGRVESASATMITVTVNGQVFPVRGLGARTQFLTALYDCGASDTAIRKFTAWRDLRQATNITAGVGIATCLFFPSWLATPVTASVAGQRRAEFIVALTEG